MTLRSGPGQLLLSVSGPGVTEWVKEQGGAPLVFSLINPKVGRGVFVQMHDLHGQRLDIMMGREAFEGVDRTSSLALLQRALERVDEALGGVLQGEVNIDVRVEQ